MNPDSAFPRESMRTVIVIGLLSKWKATHKIGSLERVSTLWHLPWQDRSAESTRRGMVRILTHLIPSIRF